MRFTTKHPDPRRAFEQAKREYRRDIRRAELVATDRASKAAQKAIQTKIRAVGLGKLGGAVGQTSALRKRIGSGDNPYGVIFARGGDESSGGGALEAYSRGALITAQRGKWLAFPTRAIPRFINAGGRRFRTTPELYKASGLVTSIGRLVFKPISSSRAVLVIQKVTLSPKTGRAKADTGRRTRTRIREKEVIAFILIRVTRRAQRFDKDAIVQGPASKMPEYLAEEMERSGG